jgi:hypothetical protein
LKKPSIAFSISVATQRKAAFFNPLPDNGPGREKNRQAANKKGS